VWVLMWGLCTFWRGGRFQCRDDVSVGVSVGVGVVLVLALSLRGVTGKISGVLG
jgi:hypothetical protein